MLLQNLWSAKKMGSQFRISLTRARSISKVARNLPHSRHPSHHECFFEIEYSAVPIWNWLLKTDLGLSHNRFQIGCPNFILKFKSGSVTEADKTPQMTLCQVPYQCKRSHRMGTISTIGFKNFLFPQRC